MQIFGEATQEFCWIQEYCYSKKKKERKKKNIICHAASWESVCVRIIEASLSEIALTIRNPSTASQTL